MSKQTINIGASPNDGTGTPLRTSFDYTNQNFTELYTALGGGVGLPGATTQVIFNDGGTNLAGDAGLVYNKTTDTLTAGNATITGAATVGTTLGVTGQLSTADVLKTTGNPSLSAAGATEAFVAHNTGYGAILYGQGTTYDAALLDRNTALRLTVTTSGAQVSGDLSVTSGNVVMATSGKGIDFSATAGTGTSELLADYEEGTFTATLTGGTTNPTIPVTTTARYTKVGRLVTVQIAFENVITTGASGTIGISGLPFANGSVSSTGIATLYNLATYTGSPVAFIDNTVSTIGFFGNVSSSTFSSVTHNAGVAGYSTTTITYSV